MNVELTIAGLSCGVRGRSHCGRALGPSRSYQGAPAGAVPLRGYRGDVLDGIHVSLDPLVMSRQVRRCQRDARAVMRVRATTGRSDSSGAALRMEATHETPEHRAHLAALADPRAHPRLPARGRVGAGDARRPGRLPSASVVNLLRRP